MKEIELVNDFPLTKQQIMLIKRSFRAIARRHDRIAYLFYERVFEKDPSLRPLFKTSPQDQRMKLMQMLAILVSGLDDLSFLTTASQDLGKRHVSYGVKAAHYPVIGSALLWAMREVNPDVMTPKVMEAWEQLYAIIARLAIGENYPETSDETPHEAQE